MQMTRYGSIGRTGARVAALLIAAVFLTSAPIVWGAITPAQAQVAVIATGRGIGASESDGKSRSRNRLARLGGA